MNAMLKKVTGIALMATVALTGAMAQAKPLKLWVYDKTRIDVLTQIGKDFEAKYKIPVEVSMVDLGQIKNQFLLASGGAEAADLAIIPHDNLGGLVENGAVLAVNLGAKTSSFLQPAIDGFKYNGKMYGVPVSVENIGFFRNTALVPNAPATWDEVIAIGKKLIAEGKATQIMGYPDTGYNIFPMYTAFGGEIFGKNADGSLNPKDVQIAGAGMVKGLTLITQLVKDKQVPSTIDWDGAHVLFESGKAPFILTGPWALDRFKTSKVPYAISAFPAATKGGKAGAPFLGVQGIIISSASKQGALATAFATEFIANEKNMTALYKADQRPSAWKTVSAQAKDSDSVGFAAAGVNAIPMPSIPAMGFVWDAWKSAGDLALSGEKTPADALAAAKKQIDTQVADAAGKKK